jgi:hypothetical protein
MGTVQPCWDTITMFIPTKIRTTAAPTPDQRCSHTSPKGWGWSQVTQVSADTLMLPCCFPSLVCNKKQSQRFTELYLLWKFISTLTSGLFCFFRYFSTVPQGCPFQFPIFRICRQFSMSQFTSLAGGCSRWFLDICPSLHVEVSWYKKKDDFYGKPPCLMGKSTISMD